MNLPENAAATARNVRVVHGAMAAGVIMFAIVAHFVMLPKADPNGGLADKIPLLIGISLAACAISFVFSTRVPRPSPGESADSFWKRAAPAAQITWAFLEGAALLGVVAYSLTAAKAEIAVAGLAVLILVLMNPAYFERR